MAGLVPAIHAVRSNQIFQELDDGRDAWMPGTSPGMTMQFQSDYSLPGAKRLAQAGQTFPGGEEIGCWLDQSRRVLPLPASGARWRGRGQFFHTLVRVVTNPVACVSAFVT
jgi:hypothetical protein